MAVLPSWVLELFEVWSRGRKRQQVSPQALDAILKKYTSELPNHLQALTFTAFNKDGETIYSNAAGTQFLEADSAKVSLETPLWTSSITKLITTVACMIAVDQGLIGLDDNVREIVPELQRVEILAGFETTTDGNETPILNEVAAPITLRQLLSHTSGYTYDVFDAGIMKWSRGIGRGPLSHCGRIDGYIHPLLHEPGRAWAYGPGMDWAGRAVEVVSGLSLEDFMQKHIFRPLSMHDTTFYPEKRADNYLSRKQNHATRDSSTGALQPGGGHHLLALPAQDCIGGMGLYSTPLDLVKILKEVLGGEGKIVSRAGIDEMLTSQLNEETQAAFMEVIDGKAKYHLRQTWPDGYEGTFGLSASINTDDFPGRRCKNSMNWAGSAGLHAWIDPTSGVGGLITTQLAPPGDKMFTQCLLDLETALYDELRKSK